jgi:uncharacterized protein YqeY
MDLEAKINADIKTAMLAKDKRTLEALRAVKSAILLAKTEIGAEGAVGEEASIKILQRLVKQRKESADLYADQDRSDLEEEERFQLSIIQKYLPEQLSEEEVRGIIKRIIEEAGASTMKDMGRVMGMATRELSGRADNKQVAAIVKESLN